MAGIRQYELEGLQIGDWEVLEYLNKNIYKCKCLSCGLEREIKGYFLNNNQIPKCTHGKTAKMDLTNKTFGMWTVLGEVEQEKIKGIKIQRKWLCECSCGTIREVLQASLTNGKSTGCGCATNKNIIDLKGKTFGDWLVLEQVKPGKHGETQWLCKCSCGEEKVVTSYQLRSGNSKSCGHSTTALKDLKGQQFGEWTVLRKSPIQIKSEQSGGVYWECQCSCGAIMDVSSYVLRNEISRSCGCKTNELREQTNLEKYGVKHAAQIGTQRTPEQLDMISSKENLIKALLDNFTERPTIYELSLVLGVSRGTTKNIIEKYGLEKSIIYGVQQVSGYEKWLQRLFPCEHTSNKTILGGKELDLYYPEHNFAIEFNGNYWHSELKKDNNYNQEKTLEAAKKGVQLFHIFEYEWNNKETRNKIINLISRKLDKQDIEIIHARKCKIQMIKAKDANEFIDKYHLQNRSNAKINIGTFYNDELIGVMTFDKPRFNVEYQYEIVRLAWKDNIAVVGGTERMFKQFVTEYKPNNILTYVDISKFTGNIYSKLGFKVNKITKPNYKWVNVETHETYSRYQTTKQKLIDRGFEKYGNTEKEIMQTLGFLRVYDSGNLRLAWEEGRGVICL